MSGCTTMLARQCLYQSSGGEWDAFLRRSGDASHSTKAAASAIRLVDVRRSLPPVI
jgi:hypothetical protein